MASTSAPRTVPESVASAGDLATLAELYAALGADVLREELRSRFASVEKFCEEFEVASRRGKWQAAARIALEIANDASNLGFRAVPGAARSFAAAVEEGLDAHTLRNGAQMVVFEYERLRLGIQLEYPDLLV